MKKINGIEIAFEEVKEDVTKVIPLWMDEEGKYGRPVWLNWNYGGYDRLEFKTMGGLKRSITCHVKGGGIPSGKITVKYNRYSDGHFEAWVNYHEM